MNYGTPLQIACFKTTPNVEVIEILLRYGKLKETLLGTSTR